MAELSRPSWHDYFLIIAKAVSTRADCSRRKVGALIVRDHRIVATGYNGAAPGAAGCLAGFCPRSKADVEPGSSYDTGPGTCIAIHAEANAMLYAGVDGCIGSTMYVTREPCDGCKRLINASGLREVMWPKHVLYRGAKNPFYVPDIGANVS